MKKTILLTGPTHGVGRATALNLAAQGHKLFLLCRNEQLGKALCEEINQLPNSQSPQLLIADLGNTAQIRAAAEKFLALNEPLHVLINNAGVVNLKRILVNVEGREQEQMFAVNHLGHFLLTHLLLPKLIETADATGQASRIVVVSSEAHALFCKGLDFNDLSHKTKFSGMKAYGYSKLANILMVKEIAKRVDVNEVQINCLHPGAVKSNLGVNAAQNWFTRFAKTIINLFLISPEKGAETSIYLATENISTQGEYYYRKKILRVKPWALDEAAAAKLWDVSEEILKL